MAEAEDFEPYRKLKNAARKASEFVRGGLRAPSEQKAEGTRRTDEENAKARAESESRATQRQNVKAYNRSVSNLPGAQKQMEMPDRLEAKELPRWVSRLERKPIKKPSARSSSRR